MGCVVLHGAVANGVAQLLAAAKVWSIQRCRLGDVMVVVVIQLIALASMFAIRLPGGAPR